MIYQEQLAKKIQALPDPLARMVDLFVDFLLLRYRQGRVDDLNPELLRQIAAQGGAFDWFIAALNDFGSTSDYLSQ